MLSACECSAITLPRQVAENAADSASFARATRIDPKIRSLAHVDVDEPADGIDANTRKSKLASKLGNLIVAHAGNHEVHRAPFAVVGSGAASGSAIAREDTHFGGLEVNLKAVDRIHQAGIDRVLVPAVITHEVSCTIEIFRGEAASLSACGELDPIRHVESLQNEAGLSSTVDWRSLSDRRLVPSAGRRNWRNDDALGSSPAGCCFALTLGGTGNHRDADGESRNRCDSPQGPLMPCAPHIDLAVEVDDPRHVEADFAWIDALRAEVLAVESMNCNLPLVQR